MTRGGSFELFPSDIGRADDPFSRFGLVGNPFPESGAASDVFYVGHLREPRGGLAPLDRVNQWFEEVMRASGEAGAPAGPVPPLALFGSIGTGKTHLLGQIEKQIRLHFQQPVLRRSIPELSGREPALAHLVLPAVVALEVAGVTGDREPLLLALARGGGAALERARAAVDDMSPIRQPLDRLVEAGDLRERERLVEWFQAWLRRGGTTPAQRNRLGLGGTLRAEGQATRVLADLLRAVRAAGLIRAWFLLIDQVEDLWRTSQFTANQRARILTDLRQLVDQAHEGAPIAVVLAWNTKTWEQDVPDAESRLRRDYAALWQRLKEPVNLPKLPEAHVWPFAEEYLRAAGVTADAGRPRLRKLHASLKERRGEVVRRLDEGEGARRSERSGLELFAPERPVRRERAWPARRVLEAWRRVAEEVAGAEE